jgi:hypothetical protein
LRKRIVLHEQQQRKYYDAEAPTKKCSRHAYATQSIGVHGELRFG